MDDGIDHGVRLSPPKGNRGGRGLKDRGKDTYPRLFRMGHKYCSILRGVSPGEVENVIRPKLLIDAEKSRMARVALSRLISRIAWFSCNPGTRGETRMLDGLVRSMASLKTVAVRLPVTSSKYRIAPAAIGRERAGDEEGGREGRVREVGVGKTDRQPVAAGRLWLRKRQEGKRRGQVAASA
jgi:hypothetical protein